MNIIISNTSDKPIYEQIVEQIKKLIVTEVLKSEQQLPSIRNLAKELQISVITTKRAYEELEREGYIVTVPGKGSYVASQNKALLEERKIHLIEEKLIEVIATAKMLNIKLDKLCDMLKLLYEEV